MPRRVQIHRRKGWRMPTGTIKVDRTTPFGNPFSAATYGRETAVRMFEDLLQRDDRSYVRERDGKTVEYPSDAMLLTALGDKNLACWCGPGPCHADVLLSRVEALGEPFDEDPEAFA